MSTPTSTARARTRLDHRRPGKNRPKAAIVRKPGIIGEDFWKIFDEAKARFAIACQPVKGGRPRRMTKNWGRDE